MIRTLFFVELAVSDWKRSVEWYRTVLGLPVVFQQEMDQFAIVQAGSGQVALKAGKADPGAVLLTFEVDDLEAELQRLDQLGVGPNEPVTTSAEGYKRALLCDPDGYRLCLFGWHG